MNIAVSSAVSAVKSLSQVQVISKAKPFVLPLPDLRVLILLLTILFTTLALIYSKDLSRRLFINYQIAEQTTQKLQVERSKLILEESTWATPARVQQIAMQQNMQYPTAQKLVLIRTS